MYPRSSPRHWVLRFLIGIGLIVAAGLGAFRGLVDFDPAVTIVPGVIGFLLALSSINPLVRFATLESRTRRAWSEAAAEAFAVASLPRRVYYLLAAIAEADGPMSVAERETVRRFVLEKFAAAADIDTLQSWEARSLPITDRVGLAARVAAGLDESELDSLFCWCCVVAFADGKFRTNEHAALQDVAKGLGIEPGRARFLFHVVRAQYVNGKEANPRARPASAADARANALAVLGLPADASADTIRKRHRQLVRQFHPDAQPRLGPVALREATERFQEIQRAYEVLTS